ncbi:hypothetical protein SLA2020_101370 [Shorea laevis]
MASLDRLATATATAIAACLPLITLIMLTAEGRELRPSNHGLEYQVPPPTGQKSPPEMMSFFGNTTSSSSTPANVAQPRAMNSSESSWWESGSGSGGRSGRGDRLRHVLLVASLVCGGTGAALLVATAFIHLYRYQKRRSSSSTHDNNANNSIVIRK